MTTSFLTLEVILLQEAPYPLQELHRKAEDAIAHVPKASLFELSFLLPAKGSRRGDNGFTVVANCARAAEQPSSIGSERRRVG